MGSSVILPDDGATDREGQDVELLGDVLSGRLAEADTESVEAARERRE